MIRIVLLLGIVGLSRATGWGYGGHDGGGLTLGEISLDHGLDLPLIGGHDGGHGGILLGDGGGWHSDIGLGGYGGYGGGHGDGHGGHGGHYIPVVKHIGVPVAKAVPIQIHHPVVQTVPQPYPVAQIVNRPVPYEVVKTEVKTVEKKVPTPVEKIVPYKVEKPVPFKVVKHIPVPVEKPVPIKIPVYKTIVHRVKGHHH